MKSKPTLIPYQEILLKLPVYLTRAYDVCVQIYGYVHI